MKTRFAALVTGLLIAWSMASPVAQAPPTTSAQTAARIEALRRAQQAAPSRMPSLIGQLFQSAQQDSRVLGLKLHLVPRERETSAQRPGVILDHEPAPNAAVRPGMTVTVFVAVAERQTPGRGTVTTVDVPRLVGMEMRAGGALLSKLNLTAQTQFVETTRFAPGTIVDQKPEPGTRVRVPSTVLIVVARARPEPPPDPKPDPPPDPGRGDVPTVPVPRLVGMEMRAGGALLSKLNLSAQTQFVETTRFTPGTIVEQRPEPGTRVRLPYTVLIVVARQRPELPQRPDPPFTDPQPPPKLYQMPDLVGRTLPIAERDPQVRELRLQLTPQYDTTATGLPNTIVRQSVAAGSGIEIGRAVTVFIASGVSVPPVVRQQADVAEQRIVAVGLNPRRMQETSTQAPGTVLRQVPEAGTLVARGAAVAITVAVPPRVIVPDLVGRARVEAMQELERLQLRASPVDDDASVLPPEQVVSQVPSAGTPVVVGASVRMAVATGVRVPNLSGLAAQDARQAVAQLGLSFEDGEAENDAAPPDRVFEQQPAAGTAVARGSRVRATLAVPVPVTVPNVRGLPRAEAERTLTARRLTSTAVDDGASTEPPDRVIGQTPAAGAMVRPGTSVRLTVATGVIVPSVTGLTRERAAAIAAAAGLRIRGALDGITLDRVVQRQDPAPNSRVARQSAITLFFAQQEPPSGPAPPPTPPLQPPPAPPGPPQEPVGLPSAPAAPLLPPWLLSLIVVLASVALSTVRLWWPQRSAPPPPVHAAAPAMPPPPAIAVHPDKGDSTQRLEVVGRSLVSFDVRVRVERGIAEQSLDAAGESLVIEERRLYE
jgi:beta-lactam-binding protein with PASTA domain